VHIAHTLEVRPVDPHATQQDPRREAYPSHVPGI
jgi:hypothetical protein